MSWTFLTGSFPDGLVDLENIHAPALDGACVGCSDRNGVELLVRTLTERFMSRLQ
jgi:hypothetical protein